MAIFDFFVRPDGDTFVADYEFENASGRYTDGGDRIVYAIGEECYNGVSTDPLDLRYWLHGYDTPEEAANEMANVIGGWIQNNTNHMITVTPEDEKVIAAALLEPFTDLLPKIKERDEADGYPWDEFRG